MPAPDAMLRQRLRQYHRDFLEQMKVLERGLAGLVRLREGGVCNSKAARDALQGSYRPASLWTTPRDGQILS